jgi:hypothetical protein
LEFKKGFIEQFSELFGESNEGVDEYNEEQQFNVGWGWYNSFYQLSKGDIRRFGEVGKLPLYQCMTFLSYEKQKQEIELRKIQKQ